MKESFVFVLSLIDFEDDLPIEVITKHFFQKANAEQISVIRELLVRLHPHPWRGFPYEYDLCFASVKTRLLDTRY